MAFDGEAVFIGSFNLDPRSALINTEAGLYIESAGPAKKLTDYMGTGVAPANSYRVRLDPNGKIVWETEKDGKRVRYQDEPEPAFDGGSSPTCGSCYRSNSNSYNDPWQPRVRPAFCGLGRTLVTI